MKTNKTIQEMIDEIEFKSLGEYRIIQGYQTGELFYVNDAICDAHHFLNDYYILSEELITNAVLRGNKEDGFAIASAKVILGKKGWILRIRDSGYGFDFEEVLRTGRFQFGGEGLKNLKSRQAIEFNYEDNGSTVNVMGFYS